MAGAGVEQSLGEYLRLERESRGLTLEQVASGTKIAVRVLSALEADQYCDLPAKPFVRGFVNSYARFLGLDSKEVLTSFGDYIERRTRERPKKEQGHSGYAFEKRETEQSRTILGFILGAFLLGGIVFIILKPSLRHHKSSHIDKLKELQGAQQVVALPSGTPSELPALAQAVPVAMASPVPAPAVSPAPAAPVVAAVPSPIVPPVAVLVSAPVPAVQASPVPSKAATHEGDPKKDPLNSGIDIPNEEVKHKAVFRALDDVWVRFQVDGRKPMRFIVRKEKVLVLRAREGIRFQVSDPNLVRFTYNNRAAKLMTEEKSAVTRGSDLTLFFPAQLAESTSEPFPGAPKLQGMSVPERPTASASPTPEQ